MIEVTSVNPINKGDMLASVSVRIAPWKLKINKICVFQKGENRWVALPREKYEDREGNTQYKPLMEFDDSQVDKRFRDQIMGAVDEYMEKNGGLNPEDVIKQDEQFPF